MSPARGLIAAIGHPFAGDDGVGLEVGRALREETLPDGIEVHEFADPARLIDLAVGVDLVVVVDALVATAGDTGEEASALPPGRVLVLRSEDVAERREKPISTHGLGVIEALALMDTLLDRPPEVVLVGVVIPPARRYSDGLSREVSGAVSKAVRAVQDVLSSRLSD